mgnify:FL=1
MLTKKTKIICTMGPATDDDEVLKDLMRSGMDIARLNFSHGDHEEQLGRIKRIKKFREELNLPIAILLDTKGPEIRTGLLETDDDVELVTGQEYTLTTRDIKGNNEITSITYAELPQDVEAGNTILIDDGLIELKVKEIKDGTDIVCDVINGGLLGSRKGVNVPNVRVNLPSITEKDKADIEFGLENGIDFIAASFIRNAEAVEEIKDIIGAHNMHVGVISKIENMEGVENIDAIIDASAGIMVARGDLGVEVPAEEVPFLQKEIIRKCNDAFKPVVTATQMLDSMIRNPRPTRAEATDVANAIYDGTDAIMLSGESASGLYPQEAVMMMSKIALKTEGTLDYQSLQRQAIRTAPDDTSEAICMSVAEIAYKFNVAAIIAFTESGFTARKMARYRTKSRIIAATPSIKTVKALALNWGVKAVPCKPLNSRISMIDYASIIARENGVKPGQKILVTGGTPGVKGATSYLELVEVK